MRRIFALILFCCVFVFSGCDNEYWKIIHADSSFTDESGNTYYIVNENYFKFDTYNVLEVIINDNEKFILYDTEDDGTEMGYGEWLRNGKSIPIFFSSDTITFYVGNTYLHGDIYIYFDSANPYFFDEETDLQYYIAKLSNDESNPKLYWWEYGHYPYNVTFIDESVQVSLNKLTIDNLPHDFYLNSIQRQFWTWGEDSIFYFENMDLCFSSMAGTGVWKNGPDEYPVKVDIDVKNFKIYVFFDTADKNNGKLFFVAEGVSLDESAASCNILFAPDICLDIEISTDSLIKQSRIPLTA